MMCEIKLYKFKLNLNLFSHVAKTVDCNHDLFPPPLVERLVQPVVAGSVLEGLSEALSALGASPECSLQVRTTVEAARRGHLWALKGKYRNRQYT